MAFQIEATPERRTSEGLPGAWYWPDLEDSRALIARRRLMGDFLASETPPAPEQVAEACGLRVDECREDMEGALRRGQEEVAALLLERPHVRLLTLTNRELSELRARSPILRSAFSIDSKGAIQADPVSTESRFQQHIIRQRIPEVRGIEGVLQHPDGRREVIPLETGADLVDWVERTSNPGLDLLLGDLANALVSSALLEPGLGEASASRPAGSPRGTTRSAGAAPAAPRAGSQRKASRPKRR